MEKMKENPNSPLKIIREDPNPEGWWKTNLRTREDLIGPEPSPDRRNGSIKTQIKKATHTKLRQNITEGQNKTKTKFYLENKRNPQVGRRAKYLDQCNRMQASLIFRARNRMLSLKRN